VEHGYFVGDRRGQIQIVEHGKNTSTIARVLARKPFPAAAEKQGMSGTAVVSFTVNAQGRRQRRKIVRSSGHAILDQAAVAMVHKASPFPPVPANLGKGAIAISAPVRFDLR
jgi:protein TonB